MSRDAIRALRQAADMQGLSMEFAELLADAERWAHVKGGFSPMGLNIDGLHSWTWRGHHKLERGPNIDAAVDAAMSKDDTALRNLNAASEAMGEEL